MAQLDTIQPRRFGKEDLALLGVALVWGGNAVVIKFVLRSMSPLTFNGIRFILAAVAIMVLLVRTERSWWLPWRDWGKVAWLGFVGHAVYQYAFIEGIARTSASNASLLQALVPLIVAVWSGLAGFERLTRRVWVGVGVSLVGAVLVILARNGGLSHPASGDLIVFVACIAMASYTILSRDLIARYSALKLSAWAMLFGALFLIVFCMPALLRQDWGAITVTDWLGEMESFSLSIVAAFIVYGWAIQRIGGARSALYLSLNPIFAALLAWAWLAEAWSPVQWAGALLALGGVVLARWA